MTIERKPGRNWNISEKAAALHAGALVWEMHGCLPLKGNAPLDDLKRFADAGVNFASINAGFDGVSWTETLATVSRFRHWLLEHPDYVLVETAEDIDRARTDGRLAIAFDIEGADALNGDLSMVSTYYALGARWMLIAYNKNNLAGGGCHDEDCGLTDFGRDMVREMNRVGMIVDCSHTGARTTLAVMEVSDSPVTFSHSNPAALVEHRRNITDEQIKACAATGGVIGINGIGLFLGNNDASAEAMVRHIDYVTQLVGPEHVGLGVDYVFDQDELNDYLAKNPDIFPPGGGYGKGLAMAPPEVMPELTAGLLARGYAEKDIRGILGENFMRVARAVWKKPERD